MNVEIIKYPTEEDWKFCKEVTLNTMGKKMVNSPTDEWKRMILKSEHSPIRTLWFAYKLEVAYYISVHYCRHKYGVEHFVQSQRDDRNDNPIPRAEKPQGEMVSHILYVNAQELMFMARRRLCNQASKETREVMEEIVRQTLEVCPQMEGLLVPNCKYLHHCPEPFPCNKEEI